MIDRPRYLVTLAAGFAALAATILPALPAEPGFRPLTLTVKPIETFMIGTDRTRFGALDFRGGLELRSDDGDFSSLSGIDFSLDGSTLVAIADTGHWFAARPIVEDGRLTGLVDARIASILNNAGEALAGKQYGDAEGLRIVARGGAETALVTFEVTNDLRQFVAAPDLSQASSTPIRLPASVKGLRRSAGLEAVAIAPADSILAGAIVLVAERSLDKAGNHRGWIVGGPRSGAFSLKRIGNYDATDAAFLPDGDLLVLERRFNLSDGVGMRIRRIAAKTLKPGAVVDGEVLIEADLRYQIDNMEGMAVRVNEAGETIIALVSDDNDNLLQRTLLLFFALAPDAPAAAASGERPKS